MRISRQICFSLVTMVMLLIPSLLYAGNLRFTPVEPHHNNVLAAKFTKDGARTISVDDSGVLIEWDFINKQIIRRIKAPISTSGTALSGDNTKAVFIAEDGRVVIYDLGLGKFQEVDFSIMRARKRMARYLS